MARLIRYAESAGVMGPDAIEVVEAQVRAEVEAALDRALSYPVPGPEEIFRHVLADRHDDGHRLPSSS